MKIKYRVLAMASAMAIALMCCGCGNSGRTDFSNTKPYDDFDIDGISQDIVCENESFSLLWDNRSKQVSFTDKKSGKVYCSMPEKTNNSNIKSPVIVSYYSPSTFSDTNAFASTEAIETDSVYAEKMDNGVRVYYDFINLETAVPVEYTIEEDFFRITVKPEDIYDKGDNYITGISIAPFLCSVKNDTEDSYLFYPDGSGTLLSNDNIDKIGDKGSKRVYGEDMLVSKYDLPSYTKQINLPVFGAKSGENALFAVITDGAELAYLNWNVGSGNLGYSAVYPYFRIRGYNLVNPPARFANTKAHIQVFDSYITNTPVSVAYYTLSGEDANYSAMASCYRNYLKNEGLLNDNSGESSDIALKLIGGINKKSFTFGIPHTVLHPLTTLANAKEMLEFFSENGKIKVTADLVGFGKSGLDMGSVGGGFEIGKSLGDKKEAKGLAELAKKVNADLFMDFDIVTFNTSSGGFSAMDDSAKLPAGQTAYLYFSDNVTRNYDSTERYMLLSRAALKRAAYKAVDATDSYGIGGVSLYSLSSVCYADYGINNAELGSGMADSVNKLFKDIKKNKQLMASAANVYAVYNADFVSDAPLGSSKYNISKCDVPFYEMVFRGSVSMSSEAINLAVDSRKLWLSCVETGITPSYTLIGSYDNTAVGSKYSALYGAQYEGLKEEIKNTSEEFKEILSKLGKSKIVGHNVLENGLRITEYENGAVTAVNHSDTAVSYNGSEIGGRDYMIWEADN